MNSYPWIYTPFDALKGLQDELRTKETDTIVSTIVSDLFDKLSIRDKVKVIYSNQFVYCQGKVSNIAYKERYFIVNDQKILFDQVYYLKIQ